MIRAIILTLALITFGTVAEASESGLYEMVTCPNCGRSVKADRRHDGTLLVHRHYDAESRKLCPASDQAWLKAELRAGRAEPVR
jgi:hypothetical protein